MKPYIPVDNVNSFSDPTLSINDWIEQFKVFKDIYGGDTLISTNGGYNNVSFEIIKKKTVNEKLMDFISNLKNSSEKGISRNTVIKKLEDMLK